MRFLSLHRLFDWLFTDARERTLGALTALETRDMLTVKAAIFTGVFCVCERGRRRVRVCNDESACPKKRERLEKEKIKRRMLTDHAKRNDSSACNCTCTASARLKNLRLLFSLGVGGRKKSERPAISRLGVLFSPHLFRIQNHAKRTYG